MPQPAARLALLSVFVLTPAGGAAEPLHDRIDALILAKARGRPASVVADDAEFLRRVSLDLAGRIPSAPEARAFLADKAADKRARLIDRLLGGSDYPRRMADLFHVMLMERLGDHAEWTKYLRDAFAANKPWDRMAREILAGRADDDATRGAAFFLSKRLENYGQNPVDYPALTRDVGRLFLGLDLQCAQCHDHLFIKDYKQQDFQGLFAFFENAYLQDPKTPAVGEKVTSKKLAFQSVFRKVPRETGPRVPGGREVEVPAFKKGEEFLTPPDPRKRTPGVPRFSPLAKLAETLPSADNAAFRKNIVNRLWWVLMGHGLVHPLDLHHGDNPPSHPELLDLLAREFRDHKFDIKWLLRELALSRTYQRSGELPPGADKLPPETFLTANEKRLSAEQLFESVLEATGERATVTQPEALLAKFQKAFANPPREAEQDISPTLKGALFVLNDETVLGRLAPRPGNLIDRLSKLPQADAVAEELYLSVLTRMPAAEEKAMVASYLEKNKERRPAALGHLAWALLASTEFGVNH